MIIVVIMITSWTVLISLYAGNWPLGLVLVMDLMLVVLFISLEFCVFLTFAMNHGCYQRFCSRGDRLCTKFCRRLAENRLQEFKIEQSIQSQAESPRSTTIDSQTT